MVHNDCPWSIAGGMNHHPHQYHFPDTKGFLTMISRVCRPWSVVLCLWSGAGHHRKIIWRSASSRININKSIVKVSKEEPP
jgi:hypothetical protein